MADGTKSSPLLLKYLRAYEEKPKSKVFAPLAETYRKLGMHDEASRILKNGLRNHPDYNPAYLVLANCYFDKEKFELAYSTLRPIVSQSLDNLSMQKLFAECCLKLGYKEEALDTFKYILYQNPKDTDSSAKVELLEGDLKEVVVLPREKEEKSIDESSWVQVDLTKVSVKETTPPSVENLSRTNEEQQRSYVDIPDKEIEHIEMVDFSKVELEPSETDEGLLDAPFESVELDRNETETEEQPHSKGEEFENYLEESTNDWSEDEKIKSNKQNQKGTFPFATIEGDKGKFDYNEQFQKKLAEIDDSPMITHTLAELYMAQGHYRKALEVLQKFVEMGHKDDETLNKIEEVKKAFKTRKRLEPENETFLQLDDGIDSDEEDGDASNFFQFAEDEDIEQGKETGADDESESVLLVVDDEDDNDKVAASVKSYEEQEAEDSDDNDGHADLMRAFDDRFFGQIEENSPDTIPIENGEKLVTDIEQQFLAFYAALRNRAESVLKTS